MLIVSVCGKRDECRVVVTASGRSLSVETSDNAELKEAKLRSMCPPHEVDERGRTSFVEDVDHVDRCHRLEQFPGKVRRHAGSG